MTSRRQERVDETVRRQVSETILFELKDPRIAFVTVTRVETSRDFTLAKVYVSVMGEPEQQHATVEILQNAAKFVQSRVAPLLKTRNVPAIRFILDDSVKKSIRVSQLLHEAMGETQGNEAKSAEENAAED